MRIALLTTPQHLRPHLASLAALLCLLLAGPLWAERPETPAETEAQAPETSAENDEAGRGEAEPAPPATSRSAESTRESGEEHAAGRVPARSVRFSWAQMDPEPHRWTGEPISLSLRDADLVEVLRSFGKMTDANLVIDPSVQGKVTVELKNVPWDQALYVILKSNDLGMEISGNVWSLRPMEKLLRDR